MVKEATPVGLLSLVLSVLPVSNKISIFSFKFKSVFYTNYFGRVIVALILCISIAQRVASQTVDLSERDYEFQYRRVDNPDQFLMGCVENHLRIPCSFSARAFILGPQWIRRVVDGPLSGLPNPLNNLVASTFPGSECSSKERKLLENVLFQRADDGLVRAVSIPSEFEHCFSNIQRDAEEREWIILFAYRGNIVAQVRCAALEAVPNPGCTLLAYPTNGAFKVSVGRFPLVNLRKLILEAPLIVDRFLASIPKDFPRSFTWEAVPHSVELDFEIEEKIRLVEERL